MLNLFLSILSYLVIVAYATLNTILTVLAIQYNNTVSDILSEQDHGFGKFFMFICYMPTLIIISIKNKFFTKKHIYIEEAIDITASLLHESWRKDYRKANGNKPRIKTTTDTIWIERNGSDQVNINKPYASLPFDWQKENYEAAKFIINLILLDGDIDNDHLAFQVHNAWLKRNDWAKGSNLDVPYWDLPQEEKDKDLLHVQIGRKILQKYIVEELDVDDVYDYDPCEDCDAYHLSLCKGKCSNCKNHSNFIPIVTLTEKMSE